VMPVELTYLFTDGLCGGVVGSADVGRGCWPCCENAVSCCEGQV
jgi:hypothetical protein